MTPEEKKKWEIVEQNKLRMQEEMRKKQEYIALMQKQSKEDRERKAEQPVIASRAN